MKSKMISTILSAAMAGYVLFPIKESTLTLETPKNNYYPNTIVVSEIQGNDKDAIVIGVDSNNEQWKFVCDDAFVGDIYSCVMDDNGTLEIEDDEIVCRRYEGMLSDWAVKDIENIQSTETGMLITFKDGTGYYWGRGDTNENICTLDEE